MTCVYTTAEHLGAGRSHCNVEVNENQTNENRHRLLMQSLPYSKAVGRYHLHLTETQRQGEEWRSLW